MKQSDHADVSRRNGRRSKGPVTAAGKEKSRMNAVTHGLFAKAMPGGRMPVFADRREFTTAVQHMAADLGVTTTLGRSLVETLAMDLLRLRHVRSMELAVLDPGQGSDRELEAAMRDRDSAGGRRCDEETEILLLAYAAMEAQLELGGRLEASPEALPLMAADLWRVMNEARQSLERHKAELRETDAEIAAGNTGLAESRALTLEDIATDGQDMRETDREVFLVGRQDDIAAYLSGRKRIAPAQRAQWSELARRRRGAMEYSRQQVAAADLRIGCCRRRHLLAAVENLGKLNLLGEYEDRIRRSIAKTLALIRDTEGVGTPVIDVGD